MARTTRDMEPHKFWRNPDVMGFVQKIAANPDDDLPRLVMCDYLEETGGDIDAAHAQFIRESLFHLDSPLNGYGEKVPPVLRGRVYAGFPFSISHNVRLIDTDPAGAGPFARVERGFLSKVWFGNVALPRGINGTLEWIERAKPSGVLTAAVYDRGAGKPIGMSHPFYVTLDDTALLELETLRGEAMSFGRMAMNYCGERFEFLFQNLNSVGPPGEYVIRETLTRYWEKRFKAFGWPVRVIPTPELVAQINKGISRRV